MSFSGTNPPSEAGEGGEPFSLPQENQQAQNASFCYGSNNRFNTSFYSNTSDHANDPSRSVSMQDIRAPYYGMSNYVQPQQIAYQPYPHYNVAAFQRWVEDYKRWWYINQHHQRERERSSQQEAERARMTPLNFPQKHSRVTFGGLGQIIVAKGTAILVQQVDPSLLDYQEQVPVTTWPGPLIKGETKMEDIKEYIRVREGYLKSLEHYPDLYEKRLLWNLLSMEINQAGRVSGSDLAELLVSTNETLFAGEGSSLDEPMNQLRKYLTLGQRKTALDIATKCGLWSHAFALTHFNIPRESRPEAIGNVVSKFTNSTLSPEDPLYLLYRYLLKPPTQPVLTETLPQFAILLANDCEVSSTVNEFKLAPELLKLMVALKTGNSQHLVNVDSNLAYTDERVFINEILEFTRESSEFLESLVPLKLNLIGRLFDFGMLDKVTSYCLAIRQYYSYYNHYFANKKINDSSLNWQLIMDFITKVECKIYGIDVTSLPPQQQEQQQQQQGQQANQLSQQTTPPSPTRTNSISRQSEPDRQLSTLVESAKEDLGDGEDVEDEEEESSQHQSIVTSTNQAEEDASIESGDRSRSASAASVQPDSPMVTSPKNDIYIPPPVPMLDTSDAGPPLSFVSQATSPVFPLAPSPIPEEDDNQESQSHSLSINRQLHSTANFSNSSFINSSQVLSPISSPPYPPSSLQPNGTHGKTEMKPYEQQLSSPVSSTANKPGGPGPGPGQGGSSGLSGSWFNSFISKVVPQGPKQAILPDDKNPSIYYDEKLKRWVNKDEPEDSSQLDAIRRGPPRMPVLQQGPPVASPTSSRGSPPGADGPIATASASVPTLAPAASLPNLTHNNFSFIKNNKRRPVYVDAWNQQQQRAN